MSDPHSPRPESKSVTREEIRATLPHAINFLFLPPRVVTDPVWDGVAADIFDALPSANPTASAETEAAWEALKRDIIKSCPDDFPIAILAVTAHRPLIEAAIRSAGTPPASREEGMLPCGYVFGLTGATCGKRSDHTLHRAGSHDATPTTPVHDYEPMERRTATADRRRDEPDFLDGARLEYRECMEVRRLLGYLWSATGTNYLRPVHTLFDADDPIVADVERLAIMPDAETDR